MGRLDNIIARNRRPKRMQEKVMTSMLIGVIILLILALAVFTDLGLPPGARDAPAVAPAPPTAPGDMRGAPAAAAHERRVNDVLLRTPPARPPAH